ncbi:hypothetical protein [Pseudomonas duriflava]|uniref:hypothetical protein n=1 Tax=Pseudomonas duriflava TaxID=459528 RepID=UPI00119F30D8|nr:hypothetical protein [Pseudomonas duriflava]
MNLSIYDRCLFPDSVTRALVWLQTPGSFIYQDEQLCSTSGRRGAANPEAAQGAFRVRRFHIATAPATASTDSHDYA